MNQLADFLSLILAGVGLTVLIVWPETGPTAYAREVLLRPRVPLALAGVLDCYVCLGFWMGLLLSPVWWLYTGQFWCWSACLMVPAVFWLKLVSVPSHAQEQTYDAQD